ncbi:unnamed protein product [Symbiodinium sp. CCMP2456]|nr:unnamed protein product [Symbiodinium sp. CCMP2456]
MQAGADISSDDEAEKDEVSAARFSFDEDNKPVVSDNILQTLRREVEEALLDLRARTQRVNGRSQCPLCPFRSFSELRQLRTHVAKHHSAKNQYVCSGTKQSKIILAVYDHAASSQRTSCSLLCESAALLRETVKPPLASTCNHIDKHLRLVFDAAGPSYMNGECIEQKLSVRRVRNLYYTQSFADLLMREMILSHAQVRTIMTRCHMAARQSGNRISKLLPTHGRHWLPMLEDITTSPSFKQRIEKMKMTSVFEKDEEWTYISMDATLKLCLKLKRQEPHRAPADVRNAAPFGDEVGWRRLLTVRGRSGAVLLLHPLQSGSSEHVAAALQENFTSKQLESVQYVATDSPSGKFFSEMLMVCPNIRSMMLDPVHLAIVYEHGFWNKKSPGSKQLRKFPCKTTALDTEAGENCWGSFYNHIG